jgi:hypothetical protein
MASLIGFESLSSTPSQSKFFIPIIARSFSSSFQGYKRINKQDDPKTPGIFIMECGLVSRIYLEFCPGGDLHSWLNKHCSP